MMMINMESNQFICRLGDAAHTGCPDIINNTASATFCCLLRFGIEEAKVNRRTFSIVVLTAAAVSKLYIHIDIVTVGVYERSYPKPPKKKKLYEKAHAHRQMRTAKKISSLCGVFVVNVF